MTQKRFKEAKSLMRKSIPVTRRVHGESDETTLRLRWCYAESLYKADSPTFDDLREAVTTLEDAGRIARRVFGGAYPLTGWIEEGLRDALRARDTPPASA